jgi:Bacterial regulatory proteins, luxR family
MATVREATLELLRELRTMVFGEPGSTELPYLEDFPDDSRPEEAIVLSIAGIAQELFISPRTVNAHLGSVYAKLRFNSRAEHGLL